LVIVANQCLTHDKCHKYLRSIISQLLNCSTLYKQIQRLIISHCFCDQPMDQPIISQFGDFMNIKTRIEEHIENKHYYPGRKHDALNE
jgi:hypothetical protein